MYPIGSGFEWASDLVLYQRIHTYVEQVDAFPEALMIEMKNVSTFIEQA